MQAQEGIEPCRPCTLSKKQKHYGEYRLKCLQCCIRLVNSTRPDRANKAEQMLAAIDMVRDAPSRDAVIKELKLQQAVFLNEDGSK